MQNILIPANFTAVPYKTIAALCNRFSEDKLTLVFMHMFKLSDSETELMMLSRRSREYEQVSDDFYNGCNLLKSQNPQIVAIRIEFLYGSTLNTFKQFLETHSINMVLDTGRGFAGKINKASANPAALIQKSGLPAITINVVDYQPSTRVQKQGESLLPQEV